MNGHTLATVFPTIESITGVLRCVDPDGMAKPSERRIAWVPALSEPWLIRCPYTSCVDGGINLLSDVRDAVQEGASRLDRRHVCQGWQDSRRINKHRCLCELNFSLSIMYHNDF